MIEASHLTKWYGRHEAVSDLSFQLGAGSIYGLLGPNGAGKSTTMNLMTGCLAPTAGTITIDGLDLYKNAQQAKGKLGYLPELPPVYPDMTVDEYLRFVGQARKLKGPALQARVDAVTAQTQVQDVRRRLIKTLSKGYRQRVGIAQALIGDPEIIILDEPTVGLDPKQIAEIRDLIASLRGKHTVVLSSHILSEVQAVCDQVLILDHGTLRASGTPVELERRFSGKAGLTLSVRADQPTVERILRSVPGIDRLVYTPQPDGTAKVTLEMDEARNEQVFLAFSKAGCPILQMQETKVSLEDVFLELTDHAEQEVAHGGDL
ncbi:MAG: ABC transporter ATP-binding protein [Oscillospiraceae bacterium]|jgi:ABC-2 type transport system ATP-binding protein|nr:ABC transporter ATP-binding protein [Oscillospiraceae bacterium]